MKMTIARAHALTPRLVEVEAKGPRGGDYHFALYYGRRGDLRLVVETTPATTVCYKADDPELPAEVLKAASDERRLAA